MDTMAVWGYDDSARRVPVPERSDTLFLNRPTAIAYSGPLTAPAVTYCYDGNNTGSCTGAPAGSNLIGRLTTVLNANSKATYDNYDALGRATASTQTITGQPAYSFTYGYSASGNLTSMMYPSGRQVSFGYDQAGRPSAVQKTSPGTAAYYAQNAIYASSGAMSSLQLGPNANLFETTHFNTRLQAKDMQLGSTRGASDRWRLQNFFDRANNGNIAKQQIDVSGMGTVYQAYIYDGANRLSIAAEKTSSIGTAACPDSTLWCRQFGYDQYGNRVIAAAEGQGGSVQVPSTFSSTTNHITDAGWTYDTAYHRGTLTADPLGSYSYDAENRLVTGNGSTYYYDGDGKRIGKVASGGNATWYVYDASGQLAAEYSNAAPGSSGTLYVTTDHLGSTRVVTNTATGAVAERHDFLPFGEEITVSSGDPRYGVQGYGVAGQRMPFTGKERDAETGLDYFGARYLSSAQGRWMSPDWSAKPQAVPYADLSDPQTLNLYGYVRNNPLSRPDLDGHSDYTWQKVRNYLSGNGYRTDADVNQLTVAQTAKSHEGSTDWNINTANRSDGHEFLPGSDKCNQFVSDTVAETGKQRPTVTNPDGSTRVPTASEYADPSVKIAGLSSPKPMSEAQPGDVIA